MQNKPYNPVLAAERGELRRSVSMAAISVFIFLICNYFINSTVSLINSIIPIPGETMFWLVNFTIEIGITLPPVLFLLAVSRPQLRFKQLLRAPDDGRITALSIPIMLGGGMCTSIILNILMNIFTSAGIASQSPEYPQPQSPFGFVLFLLSMTVFPAFFEELLFRGAIMGSLRRYGDSFAVIISALLFGLLHGNLFQSLNAFALGLMLGYLAIRSGSILTSMLMHFFNNLFFTGFEYILKPLSEQQAIKITLIIELVLLALAIIATLILMAINRRTPDRVPVKSAMTPAERMKTGLSSPGMLVAVIYFGFVIATKIQII